MILYDQRHNFNNLLTNHFMQQLTVALSKQNTQIQNFRNVKQEIVIDNFSKHSRGDEAFLRELIVSDQSIYWQRSSSIFLYIGSYFRFFMCGHSQEGQEDCSVNSALHVGHCGGWKGG